LPGNHRFLDLRGESGPLIACLDVERFALRYQTGRHLDQSLRGGVVEREREADGYGPEVEDACSDLGRKRSDVHLANLHVQWLMAQNDTRTCCGVRPAQDAGSASGIAILQNLSDFLEVDRGADIDLAKNVDCSAHHDPRAPMLGARLSVALVLLPQSWQKQIIVS